MANMLLRNVEKVDLTQFAPPTALSVEIRVTIKPASGTILIYGGADITKPITCLGPSWSGSVGYGDGSMYVQKAGSTEAYEIEFTGYTDNL